MINILVYNTYTYHRYKERFFLYIDDTYIQIQIKLYV